MTGTDLVPYGATSRELVLPPSAPTDSGQSDRAAGVAFVVYALAGAVIVALVIIYAALRGEIF